MLNNQSTLLELAMYINDFALDGIANEVVLSGSVSLGMADKFSDVEMDFINDNIPSSEEIRCWIEKVDDVSTIKINDYLEPDGALASSFYCRNHKVEIIWQTYKNLSNMIEQIYKLNTTDHDFFVYAWTLNKSIILTDKGKIRDQINKLRSYPNGLDKKLISETLKKINNPTSRISSIDRNEFFYLYIKIIDDLKNYLRILYALNNQWEPYWKWVAHFVDQLDKKPQNLQSTINEIVSANNTPKKSLRDSLILRIEILDLLRQNTAFDVKDKIDETEIFLKKYF